MRTVWFLINRTMPGQGPYWTSPGGGVEDSDASVVDALRRELAEELGATADGYQQVFLSSTRATRAWRSSISSSPG